MEKTQIKKERNTCQIVSGLLLLDWFWDFTYIHEKLPEWFILEFHMG